MSRTVSLSLLDRVQIASPCPVRWEDMRGDEKIRHCAQCDLKVHNFAAMTRDEAEAILRAHLGEDGCAPGGRVCGGWYRRADGTALLQDCPRGLERVKRSARRFVSGAAALCGLTAFLGVVAAEGAGLHAASERSSSAGSLAPLARLAAWLRPQPPRALGGVIALPSPSAAPRGAAPVAPAGAGGDS